MLDGEAVTAVERELASAEFDPTARALKSSSEQEREREARERTSARRQAAIQDSTFGVFESG